MNMEFLFGVNADYVVVFFSAGLRYGYEFLQWTKVFWKELYSDEDILVFAMTMI